jgi:cell division GTPase FtsZ
LQGAVQGIAELITRHGLINVDFADVHTVMAEMGMAMMGSGQASGDDRAIMAAQAIIYAKFFATIKSGRVSIQAALKIIRVYAIGPAVAHFLFEAATGEVEPDGIKISGVFSYLR